MAANEVADRGLPDQTADLRIIQRNHSNYAMLAHQAGREAWQQPIKTDRSWSENAMMPEVMPEAIEHDRPLMHSWRVARLRRLGIPEPLAEANAHRLDWHQIARLVRRGCPPLLALRIVR